MKDGETFASKYESQQLKPNVVMVFSNSEPYTWKLAKVRFEVFHIINDQLQKRNMVVNGNNKNQIMQNKNSDSDSDIDSQMSDY